MTDQEIAYLLAKAEDTLIWASGSQDFGPGGCAEEGWKKLAVPLIEQLQAIRQGEKKADTETRDLASAHPSEAEMQKSEAPWPETITELTAYIQGLVDRPHDYGTAVYAMSLAAHATFRFVASHVGASGFQASVASMDVLRRTRGIKGSFWIVNGENMLYPQYDLFAQTKENLDSLRDWAREEAAKLLQGNNTPGVHPDVLAHWKRLAETDDPYPFMPKDPETLFERLADLKDQESDLMNALADAVLGPEEDTESISVQDATASLVSILQDAGLDVIVLHPEEPEEEKLCTKCGSTFKVGWLDNAGCPNPECGADTTAS